MFDYASRQRRLSERLEQAGVDALFLAPSADLEYLTGVERQIPNFGEASYAHGWVTGAFFRPGRDPVFLFPRMFAAFDLREEPAGRGDRRQRDRRRRRDLRARREAGSAATGASRSATASGPRRRSTSGSTVGFERLQTGSRIVNELRRMKTRRGARGDGPRRSRRSSARWRRSAPLVVPGVTMLELAEAVEHELLAAGSRCPSFATHIFTGLDDGDFDSHTATGRHADPGRARP